MICNKRRKLLTYKHSSGTRSLSKHIRFCQNNTNTSKVLEIQANMKQYYEPSKNQPYVPSRVKKEIIAACTEFVILDSRSFEMIGGRSFKNLAQKILNADRYVPVTREINVENILPAPTAVRKIFFRLYLYTR